MDTNYHIILDKTLDDYKSEIKLFMNTDEKLNEFLDKIDKLIKSNKGYFSDYFYFIKSYISLFFPFQNYTTFTYTPYIGGLLLGNSSNCKFTIATVNINGNQFKLFNKIVDYNEQNINGIQDLLIFDILSALIFDYILSLPHYFKYKDLIAKYKGSFLSYSHKDNKQYYWNYNNFINHTSDKSLYNPDNFQNVDKNNKVIVATYEAIDNPITITEIFKTFESDNDSKLIEDIMSNLCDIYDFLIDIGLNFGFMHNDLHMSNLLYNPTTRKIMIIDFGRASFAKFMVDDIDDINKKIMVDFEKLNYNQIFESSPETTETFESAPESNETTETFESVPETTESFHSAKKSISELLKIDGLFINFLYKNKDLFRKKYSPIAINGKYFGVIFDLITYSLNIYIRLLYFMKKTKTDTDFDYFYNKNFKNIIDIDYYDDITNLIINNVNIRTNNYTESDLLSNYQKVRRDYIDKLSDKRIYLMLLEGLFYCGLLILFNRKIKREGFIYKYFQVLNNKKELEQFKDYVIEFINKGDNHKIFTNDSFLSNFITRRTGGLVSSIKSKNSIIPLIKYKSIIKEISLKETTNAYLEIYKDYDKYRAPNDCDCSVIKGGFNKRILKKYKK